VEDDGAVERLTGTDGGGGDCGALVIPFDIDRAFGRGSFGIIGSSDFRTSSHRCIIALSLSYCFWSIGNLVILHLQNCICIRIGYCRVQTSAIRV
jgi:hypothetical protein